MTQIILQELWDEVCTQRLKELGGQEVIVIDSQTLLPDSLGIKTLVTQTKRITGTMLLKEGIRKRGEGFRCAVIFSALSLLVREWWSKGTEVKQRWKRRFMLTRRPRMTSPPLTCPAMIWTLQCTLRTSLICSVDLIPRETNPKHVLYNTAFD